MDLRPSMELAGRNLINMLDPTHQYMPFTKIDINRELNGWALLSGTGHNIGRW